MRWVKGGLKILKQDVKKMSVTEVMTGGGIGFIIGNKKKKRKRGDKK